MGRADLDLAGIAGAVRVALAHLGLPEAKVTVERVERPSTCRGNPGAGTVGMSKGVPR